MRRMVRYHWALSADPCSPALRPTAVSWPVPLVSESPSEHQLTRSDFFSSPLPSVNTDEFIDVVVCDFALDDFREPLFALFTAARGSDMC